MTNTINNAIPYVPENTIDPAAGLNISLNTIDALLQCRVVSIGDNDPPSEGVEGDRYIVGDTPTGEWSEDANRLAVFLDGAWDFYDAWIVLNATDNLIYIKSASDVWARSSANVGSFDWASKPEASSIPANALVFINDFPLAGAIGSWWKPLPVFNLYAPISGDLLLSINFDKSPTDGTSDDQKMQSVFIPAGVISPNYRVEVTTAFSKDSGAIAGTYRFRIGATDTDADAVVHEVTVDAATRSGKIQSDIYFVGTANAVSVTPTTDGSVSQSTTVWPADVTIDDYTVDDIYLSVWFEPAGATIMELINCRMTLFAI